MDQLIASGLSIRDSLEILAIMDEKTGSSKLANSILEQIKKGNSFADTVNDFSNYFSPIYRGIIKVGDRIGSVEKIFPKIKSYLEDQKKIKDKISSALIYPILVLITALIAFIVMIFFVFPKLKTMFAEFGGTAAVKLENNINNMEIGIIVILCVVLLITFTVLILRQLSKKYDSFHFAFDTFVLKLPFIKKVIIYKDILNFAFAMETLTASGITIEAALLEAMSVISNEVIKSALEDIHERIVKGESLSSSFAKHKIFPSYINKWILVGERSGKTEQIFTQIKNYYQGEIDRITTQFMALIEPALIILIGILLIILIATVIIPVFSLYGDIL